MSLNIDPFLNPYKKLETLAKTSSAEVHSHISFLSLTTWLGQNFKRPFPRTQESLCRNNYPLQIFNLPRETLLALSDLSLRSSM